MERRETDGPVLDLIERVYEAAEEPARWSDFLQGLVARTDTVVGALHLFEADPLRCQLMASVGTDPAYLGRFGHYMSRNPWLLRHGLRLRTGDVSATVARRDFAGEFYSEFWAPQRFGDTLGGCVYDESAFRARLTVVRPSDAGPFEERHRSLLQSLTPHVHRAFQLQRRLYGVEARSRGLTDALDAVPYGVIVVDDRGRVVWANHAGRSILDQRNGLILVGGRLCAARPRENQKLRSLLDQAAATSRGDGATAGGVLTVPRLGAERPRSVLVSPLTRRAAPFDGPRPAAVVFLDPPSDLRLDPEALSEIYGLTPAEARVARGIAEGKSLSDVARGRRISVHTARTQLKRVLRKTGTGRQGELAAMLLGTVGALWPRGRRPAGGAPESRAAREA